MNYGKPLGNFLWDFFVYEENSRVHIQIFAVTIYQYIRCWNDQSYRTNVDLWTDIKPFQGDFHPSKIKTTHPDDGSTGLWLTLRQVLHLSCHVIVVASCYWQSAVIIVVVEVNFLVAWSSFFPCSAHYSLTNIQIGCTS